MKTRQHLAIIGSGASAIYLLKHILSEAGALLEYFREISIFERAPITGMGMPYTPSTTDRYNMSNISSEELPELEITFADWLEAQDREFLNDLGVEDEEISEGEVYTRLALGCYLNSQYLEILEKLRTTGFVIHEYPGCQVTDIVSNGKEKSISLETGTGCIEGFDKIVISTGHCWPEDDKPSQGYFASPWPISKLLPDEGEHHNFEIGTLGASLSAFDVVSSLAHRHGDFSENPDGWVFTPHPDAENFRIVMHAANGLLPHLQFDQVNPFREIYRHVSREGLLELVDERGMLRIETYYDKVCRPALTDAFDKDGLGAMVENLADPKFSLDAFVEAMSEKHEYPDAFEGMRIEMVEAERSVENHLPIHWKEVMDDLMYTLNFHCELMPAEDHLKLRSVVMPFLMNVVAAMPLNSGNAILALHDAGKLDMISGKVGLAGTQEIPGETRIVIQDGDAESTASYRMFVDCSGQKPVELEDYPFPGLVKAGIARKARAPFADPGQAEAIPDEKKEMLFQDDGELLLHTGGVDVDGSYRLVGLDGKPHPGIHDIAFPHTSGVRPYSYGLQACSHTSGIVVQSWLEEIRSAVQTAGDMETTTGIYEKL